MKTALNGQWCFRVLLPVCVATLALATGCGGGGDNTFKPPPPPDALPGGIWEGTVTINDDPTEFELVGVSTDAGEFRLLDELAAVYFANITVDGETFTGGARVIAPFGEVFSDGSTVATGRVDGTIVQRTRMSGTFTLDSGDSGTFELAYDDLHERNSSIALLGGMWGDLGGAVFTIQADGTVFAQDGLGCVYNGLVSVIDPDYNVYDTGVQVTQCGQFDGSYRGLGVIDDVQFEGDNDGFVAIMSNDDQALLLLLLRM